MKLYSRFKTFTECIRNFRKFKLLENQSLVIFDLFLL